jgi:hypothetical protein
MPSGDLSQKYRSPTKSKSLDNSSCSPHCQDLGLKICRSTMCSVPFFDVAISSKVVTEDTGWLRTLYMVCQERFVACSIKLIEPINSDQIASHIQRWFLRGRDRTSVNM